jgi:hypothetical protein
LSVGNSIFGVALPKKYSLNCAIPELLNIRVGSSLRTMGAEGTIKCPLLSKKSKIVYVRLVISLFIFFATKALRQKFF